jgi:hypothetical protein
LVGDGGRGGGGGGALNPVAQLTVLARSEAANLRTAARLGFGSGRMALAEPLAGGRLWALGTAEVYFHRPAAAPDRIEYASLWNPYWQVRMAPTPAGQQLAALALIQGGGRGAAQR